MFAPHDVLPVPPQRLREHLLAGLATLRGRRPNARMFAYKDVVYEVVRLGCPGWSGQDLVALGKWLHEFQAGYVEDPSSAHEEHPDNLRVLQAIWQLIADGIVYPRLRTIVSQGPASIEWLVVTDRGLRALSDPDHPRRPGFAERLAAKHPSIGEEVIARLGDAAACLERGVQRAGVVMIGLAFEETLRASCDAVVTAGHIVATPKIARDTLKVLRDYVERLKVEDGHVLGMALVAAENARTERNRSAHPSERFDDEEAVEELLVSATRQIPVLWNRLVTGTPPIPTT
ncbi:MAG TPA: hypothetical protein VGI39_38895 [Polyangiaceae bacterium]|jgi:hypothetical protein